MFENERWVIPIQTDAVLEETKVERSSSKEAAIERRNKLEWRVGSVYFREPEDKTKLEQVRYVNKGKTPVSVIMVQIKSKSR